MPKLLYSQSTHQVLPYPRLDDQPVDGLDPDYLVLTQTEGEIPAYNPEVELISSNWVIDLDNLEYRQEWVVNPIEPQPNWDAFNAYMLSDVMFKGYRDVVRAVDGDLTSALFTAYNRVATEGVSAFSLVWGQWCTVSGITLEDKEAIAVVAEADNLPAEFVGVIRS